MKRKEFTIKDFRKHGDPLRKCEMKDVYDKQSLFGNILFRITDEDIQALKEGSVLFAIDEYGVFLAYDND